ncbi:MAG: trypsin-like serine protease [Alphaproteobacteria bacterium]|nr:trypsin-like serine protease [Alphaproteobacteria bacterium]
MRLSATTGAALLCMGLAGTAFGAEPALSRAESAPSVNVARLSPSMAEPPWAAIGRINRRPGGFCSGTLISADKVLTSAHCVWQKRRGRWIDAEDLHFLAGYHLGTYLVHRRVAAVRLPDDVKMNRRGHPRHPVNDWAILTLERPVATGAVLPLLTKRRARGMTPARLGRLVRAGYGIYRPYALSTDTCHAVGLIGKSLLMHDCDATIFEAGHPILVKTRRGWRVLGLQMATYKRTRRENGVGMAVLVTTIPDRLTR